MDDTLITELRRRKALRFDEPVAATALVPGQIQKVVGHVRAAEEVWRAPFTGRECVAFTVRGFRPREELPARESSMERTASFWLEARGGSVWVRPDGWLRFLVPSVSVTRDDPSAWRHYNDFADRYGLHHRETLGAFTDGFRFVEHAIEVGLRVAVIGAVGDPIAPRAADSRDGYRERRMAPTLVAPAIGRLWISSYEVHTSEP